MSNKKEHMKIKKYKAVAKKILEKLKKNKKKKKIQKGEWDSNADPVGAV